MADRDGIFAGDDPFAILRAWLDAAKETEPSDPNAMVLATIDAGGLPDARVVLLKEIEPDGLVFYTNYDSRKGRQLDGAGKAAINLHWKSLRRQVRARGRVERVDAATSDAYYRSRPLGSRIGAWASRQSQEIASKAALVKAVAAAGLKHGANPARPPNWGGYRLIPDEFEFWAEGDFRLHDRFRWTRSESTDGWHISRLNP